MYVCIYTYICPYHTHNFYTSRLPFDFFRKSLVLFISSHTLSFLPCPPLPPHPHLTPCVYYSYKLSTDPAISPVLDIFLKQKLVTDFGVKRLS